jgi:DNA-binding transcriptional LysR family regulator
MSDLDRFELFAAVAQGESLTQAAITLGVTKASLSKRIKALEADFKVDLFSRHKQRLVLTAQGKILLEQCLRLMRELEDTRSICQQFNDEPEGTLRVVAIEHYANRLIFPKLKLFLKRYPKLRLFLDTRERMPDFEREQIDIAVGFSVPAPPDIVRKSIATTRYVLCASPQYFSQHGKPRNLQDLKNHRYIAHNIRPEEKTITLKPGYALSIAPYLVLNSMASMIECARQGLGLMQLPLYFVDDYLKKGQLIEVLPKYQAIDAHVYYLYPKYRYIQSKVRKFIDFFLDENKLKI